MRRNVSFRVCEFEIARLKLNEAAGSSIVISAVFVWRFVNAADALFEVDDYREFVQIQSEAVLGLSSLTYP